MKRIFISFALLFLVTFFIIDTDKNVVSKKNEVRQKNPDEINDKRFRRGGNQSLFLLYDLTERIWLTEYNKGTPVDGKIYPHVFCLNNVTKDFSIYDTWAAKKVRFEIIPTALNNQIYTHWPYNCRPIIPITNPYEDKLSELVEVSFMMMDFNGVERVIPSLIERLKLNKLGKYRISYVEAQDINTKIINENKELNESELSKLSSENKQIRYLHTYFRIDKFPWDDSPNVIPGGDAEYKKRAREWLLLRLFPNNEYDLTKDNGLVTVRMKVDRTKIINYD